MFCPTHIKEAIEFVMMEQKTLINKKLDAQTKKQKTCIYCSAPVKTKGMCTTHYFREYRQTYMKKRKGGTSCA